MKFKDLKNGYTLFFYDKEEGKVSECRMVGDASIPHAETSMSWANMVVDLPVSLGGKTVSIVAPADSEVAYPNGNVLTLNREILLREIHSNMKMSEDALGKVDWHKANVERCKAALAELDPNVKEKQENEQRFSAIESKIAGFGEQMSKMCAMMEKLVN